MLWNELVKLALLGTDRSSLSPEMKAELTTYGIDTEKEITEVVLESIALMGPLQKAGFQPMKWEGEYLEKCPEETLVNCSAKSANHLGLILHGRYSYALAEFVEAMAINGKCLPFEQLPELLDKCVKDEYLWQSLETVIGHRGQWAIQLNPAWHKLMVTVSEENWQTGTIVERKAILKKLRRENPTKGLQFLLSTWAEDGLSEKQGLLKCLSIGLSDMDEVFLEECLDFPRKEIRTIAALLLSELPHSQLQQRIFERLQDAISIGKEEGVKKPIVSLPDTSDKALIRDGINPKKKWKLGGQTTGMLYQMVAIIPPEKWEKKFNERPEALLNIFSRSEWGSMFLEAFAAAATLHQSVDWMEALLRFWLTNYTQVKWSQLDFSVLLDALPDEVFNEVLYEKLSAVKFLPDEQSLLIQLLQKDNCQWDNRLTKLVMEQLKGWIAKNATYSWTGLTYRKMLKRAAYNINPQMEKQLSHFWLGDTMNYGGWEKDLQLFLNILSFRKDMLSELEKQQPTNLKK